MEELGEEEIMEQIDNNKDLNKESFQKTINLKGATGEEILNAYNKASEDTIILMQFLAAYEDQDVAVSKYNEYMNAKKTKK